jgi:Flp pilus assembly protein protease CpaA
MFPLDIFNSMSEIFSPGNLFLMIIAVVWMIFAVIQDFRKREVANWWNFSLIVFVLAYRAFLSVNSGIYSYFLWGLTGLAVGFVLANAFYYARMFAGGDAKLLMAIGTVLPLSLSWKINSEILFWFIVLFLFTGAIYGLIYSIVLSIIHFSKFKKSFCEYVKKYKQFLFCFFFAVLLLILVSLFLKGSFYFSNYLLIFLIIFIFLCPLLFFYAKSIEDVCMIHLVPVSMLTIGDWLVKPVIAGRKIIKPNWEGLSEEELNLIQKRVHGRVLVKYGIPFTPSFLFGFLGLLLLVYFNGLILILK